MPTPKGNEDIVPHGGRSCLFCGIEANDESVFGKLLSKDGFYVHYFCMLFSSGLCQNGISEKEGILGFLIKDIKKEYRRGKRLKCNYCKKSGATIGCCSKSCRVTYHFNCGTNNGALHQYYGTYRSFCNNHCLEQDVPLAECCTDDPCPICLMPVVAQPSMETMKSPCCKNGWFHRKCIQKTAEYSGLYFFKCPMCNNKEQFQKEMLMFGIYIPDRDAAWEREPNAFEELTQRYNHCDSRKCYCRKGRDFNKDDTQWEIVLCDDCGSSGTHLRCQNLRSHTDDWICLGCRSLQSKYNTKKSQSSQAKTDSTTNLGKKSEYAEILEKKKESEYPVQDTSRSSSTGRKRKRKRSYSRVSTSTTTLSMLAENDTDCTERKRNQTVGRFWTYIPEPPKPEHSPSKVSPSKILNHRLRNRKPTHPGLQRALRFNNPCRRSSNNDHSDSDLDDSNLTHFSSSSVSLASLSPSKLTAMNPSVSISPISDKFTKITQKVKNTARKSLRRNKENLESAFENLPPSSPDRIVLISSSDTDDDIKITNVKHAENFKCICHSSRRERKFVPRTPSKMSGLPLTEENSKDKCHPSSAAKKLDIIHVCDSDHNEGNHKDIDYDPALFSPDKFRSLKSPAEYRKFTGLNSKDEYSKFTGLDSKAEYCDLEELLKSGCPELLTPTLSTDHQQPKLMHAQVFQWNAINQSMEPTLLNTETAYQLMEPIPVSIAAVNNFSPTNVEKLAGEAATTSGKPVGVVIPQNW